MVPERGWRIWISGASSGIGEALARHVAAEGGRVALFARREERLRAIASELRSAGAPDAVWSAGDVRDRDTVHRAVHEAEAAFGGLDVVVLNAGIGDTFFPRESFDGELVRRIFEVNVMGAVWGMEAALPGLLARGAGALVAVSSIAGARGLPGAAPYCASKAALSTFCESLRADLSGTGVRVVTVEPGFVRTPLTERNRFPMPCRLEPGEAARRIVRGIRRGRGVVHFPRRLTLPVKLLRCLPSPLWDRIAARLARRSYRKTSGAARGPSH